MKFRRKSAEAPAAATSDEPGQGPSTGGAPEKSAASTTGPRDIDDIGDLDDVLDSGERVDLGSLVLTAVEGLEIRLQVDEASGRVQSVLQAGPDGAVELRVFAAPRGGDLWSEVRPRIAAEYAQRGGTATERTGRYGTELVCQLTVRTENGRTATQPSRVIGINGARWMLRATLLGRPAVEPDSAGPWDAAIQTVIVRRGAQAMPVGAELPLAMPPRERLVRRDS